jgi:hypothetical protein
MTYLSDRQCLSENEEREQDAHATSQLFRLVEDWDVVEKTDTDILPSTKSDVTPS